MPTATENPDAPNEFGIRLSQETMTPPPPQAHNRQRRTLPPKRPEPAKHLDNLTLDQLVERQVKNSV